MEKQTEKDFIQLDDFFLTNSKLIPLRNWNDNYSKNEAFNMSIICGTENSYVNNGSDRYILWNLVPSLYYFLKFKKTSINNEENNRIQQSLKVLKTYEWIKINDIPNYGKQEPYGFNRVLISKKIDTEILDTLSLYYVEKMFENIPFIEINPNNYLITVSSKNIPRAIVFLAIACEMVNKEYDSIKFNKKSEKKQFPEIPEDLLRTIEEDFEKCLHTEEKKGVLFSKYEIKILER